LRQNSGASVLRYLKIIGKSCFGEKKLNVQLTLWSKRKEGSKQASRRWKRHEAIGKR
jgi:hypothetical protein